MTAGKIGRNRVTARSGVVAGWRKKRGRSSCHNPDNYSEPSRDAEKTSHILLNIRLSKSPLHSYERTTPLDSTFSSTWFFLTLFLLGWDGVYIEQRTQYRLLLFLLLLIPFSHSRSQLFLFPLSLFYVLQASSIPGRVRRRNYSRG